MIISGFTYQEACQFVDELTGFDVQANITVGGVRVDGNEGIIEYVMKKYPNAAFSGNKTSYVASLQINELKAERNTKRR